MSLMMDAATSAWIEARGWLEGQLAATGVYRTLGFSLKDVLHRQSAPEVFATTVGLSALVATAIIGVLSLAYLILSPILRKALGRKRFPGPRGYPLIGNLFEVANNMDRNLEWVEDILRKEDSTWCYLEFPGTKCVVVTDPADVEHMLKTNFANYPKGPEFHGLMSELLGDGIFNADGETWRLQRKVASHEFSTKSLKELMLSTFNRKVNNSLLPIMAQLAEKGAPFDLQEVFQRYTFDSICSIAFGEDPGCLAPDFPVVSFASAFDDAQQVHSHRFLRPMVVYKVNRLFGLGNEGRLVRAIKEVDNFAYGVIRQRRQDMASSSFKEREDLLSRFIAVADTEVAPSTSESPAASDRFLRDIILNFILAGRDTTAATLTWFFWAIDQHPEVEAKILEEIHRIKEPGSSGVFNFDDVRSMMYLQAALSETLRLYPAVPSDVKVAAADDVFPSGAVVKAGWRIAYHPYSQGRDTRVWGLDALDFKPERWLDAEGRYVQASPFKFSSFQAGPRICLGKEMAYLQMKVVASSLLRRFKITVVPSHVVTYRASITFMMKHGLQVTVQPRVLRQGSVAFVSKQLEKESTPTTA